MILEYLSDSADTRAKGTLLGDLACACERRSRTLMDVVRSMGSQNRQQGEHAALGGAIPVGRMSEGDVPPMDNRQIFAPLMQAAPPRCRTCGKGRGDVNVNVNVATGTRSSAGSEASGERRTMPTFEGGMVRERARTHAENDMSRSAPSGADLRRIIAEELRRRPQKVQPIPTAAPQTVVEYRPFAVPRDRVVIKREQRPFAVVWDRIKRIVQPRDVSHPIDRVRLVPRQNVKSTFEGTRGSAPQRGAV